MSFYSYKNSGSTHCPCSLNGNEVLSGLNEKICIQVQRVYDSCLMQEQLKEQKVTLLTADENGRPVEQPFTGEEP